MPWPPAKCNGWDGWDGVGFDGGLDELEVVYDPWGRTWDLAVL